MTSKQRTARMAPYPCGGLCVCASLPPIHPLLPKVTRNLVYGISVYSVELLSMFKCLKDIFACQDERSRLSITKRPCLLASPVWGA